MPTPPEKTATYLQRDAGFRNGFSGYLMAPVRCNLATARKPVVFLITL
jgi:hypothetical protein